MSIKKGMSFIEMVCCMAIIAVCLITMIRGFGAMGLLKEKQQQEDAMVAGVEALLHRLEHEPKQMSSGTIDDEWRYQTSIQDGHYLLTVTHSTDDTTYQFLIKEAKQ